jgi:hypothetical protein
MMTFTPLNDQAYEVAQVQIGYCKLFPLIMEDFLTRKDAIEMMKPSNLPTHTNPGQAVTTTGGPAAQSGSTVAPGQGKVLTKYNGSFPRSASRLLAKQKEAIKEGGGKATKAALGAVGEL